MGLSMIFGALSAVTSLIGGMAQANATAQAAAAQKEANAIEGAQQEARSTDSRRQRVREARIRRAQIMASSQNQGTSQSSGQLGAVGAINTNLGTMFGNSMGETVANRGISTNLQKAADYQASANAIGAWTSTISGAFSGFKSVFDP